MKWLLSLSLAFAFICVSAKAQDSTLVEKPSLPMEKPSSGRLFFPKNFIWGYTQFDIAPPHNEPDPNLCAANAGQYGGAAAALHTIWPLSSFRVRRDSAIRSHSRCGG